MTRTLALRCRCGEVTGQVEGVSPATVNRVICYCDDCRAFLRLVERADLLDPHGGVDLVQVRGTSVRFARGADGALCVRLSPRGMYRRYAACCGTPLGNTVSLGLPFAGLSRASLDVDPADELRAFGPAIGCNARFALGGAPEGAHPRASLALIARSVRRLARWKLASLGEESAYFDGAGAPRVAPRVLTRYERAALRALDVLAP